MDRSTLIGIIGVSLLVIGLSLLMVWFFVWENNDKNDPGSWTVLVFSLMFIAAGLGMGIFAMIKIHRINKSLDHIPRHIHVSPVALGSGKSVKACGLRY